MSTRLVALAIVTCGACGSTPVPSMPWLHGFSSSASSDSGGYAGLEVASELGTVHASYNAGVVVLDRSGRMVASSPAFDPTGSADEILALAIGDGQADTPMIALAVTSGGHRLATTSLVLYRVGDGRLDELFDQVVEERDGEDTRTGSVTLMPHALLYQAPDGTSSMWQLGPSGLAYTR